MNRKRFNLILFMLCIMKLLSMIILLYYIIYNKKHKSLSKNHAIKQDKMFLIVEEKINDNTKIYTIKNYDFSNIKELIDSEKNDNLVILKKLKNPKTKIDNNMQNIKLELKKKNYFNPTQNLQDNKTKILEIIDILYNNLISQDKVKKIPENIFESDINLQNELTETFENRSVDYNKLRLYVKLKEKMLDISTNKNKRINSDNNIKLQNDIIINSRKNFGSFESNTTKLCNDDKLLERDNIYLSFDDHIKDVLVDNSSSTELVSL